jgi:hypothetical protein
VDFHSNQKLHKSDWQWAFFKVCLTVYKNGVDYNLKSRTDIFHAEKTQLQHLICGT